MTGPPSEAFDADRSGKDEVLDSIHGWAPVESEHPDAHPATGETVADLRRKNDELREAIDYRAIIEQAKGTLVQRYGLDGEQAMAVLRRWSQDSHVKLHTIADTLVHAVCQGQASARFDPILVQWLDDQFHNAGRLAANRPVPEWLAEAITEVSNELGRPARPNEIAERLQIDTDRVIEALAQGHRRHHKTTHTWQG